MSKNKKKNIPALDNTAVENNPEVVVNNAKETKAEQPKGKEETSKKTNKDAKKQKKSRKGFWLFRKCKETFSELKKVTWPTFKETIKRTGVVIAWVLFFGVILFAFDYVLSVLFKLLINKAAITVLEQWLSVALSGLIVVLIVVGLIVYAVKKRNKRR